MQEEHPGITPIEYWIRLPAPQTQIVEVEMRIRNVAVPTLDVALPVWRPGRYDVLNLSGSVRNVRASTLSEIPLRIAKVDKTTWRIRPEQAGEVIIRYSIYANSLGLRTRHVDDSHAFLSGAAVFFYLPERRNDAVLVHIDAPKGWRVASGLDTVSGDPNKRYAPDYDVLVDSPLEIGIHDLIPFDVDGVGHEIVIWGDGAYSAERLVADFTRIVRECVAIFGDMPYQRYVFLLHIGPEMGGGTEHINSTIMQISPRAFASESGYRKFLGLVSHEMFHTWNVKQFRPAGIQPYDYRQENYTDLLWVAEGATSYYDDLILVRAGVETSDAYLTLLSTAITSHRNRPGAHIQSVAESSFDAWVKFNRPTPDDVNSTVSFYEAGALANLLLDMELRRSTADRVSLDTLMREMFVRFPRSGSGYTLNDFAETAGRLAGLSLETFFEKYITGVEEYPFETALKTVGLELEFLPERTGADLKPYVGLNLQEKGGGVHVASVLADGPAYLAGVNANDEIVALNDCAVTVKEFDEHISRLHARAMVDLSIFRHGRLRSIRFQVTEKPAGVWRLIRVNNPTEAQTAAYKSWLHQAWPGA